MLGADFRFTSRPASAGARHYLVCALTLILLLFGVSAGRAKAQASAANSGTRPRVIELRIGDEVEPIMAEYIDGGIDAGGARARQPGADHHGHARRPRHVDAGDHPAHSGVAGAGGRLRFAHRLARRLGGLLHSALGGHRGHGARNARRARRRRCWRSAAFRSPWTRRSKKKILNDATAFLRSYAEKRGRNANAGGDGGDRRQSVHR